MPGGGHPLAYRNIPLWGVIAFQVVDMVRQRGAQPPRAVTLSEQESQVALTSCSEELHIVLSCPVEVPEPARCPKELVWQYCWLQLALGACCSAFGVFLECCPGLLPHLPRRAAERYC